MAMVLKSHIGINCRNCGFQGSRDVELQGPGIFKLGCHRCRTITVHIHITDDEFWIEDLFVSDVGMSMGDRKFMDLV